MASRVQEAFLRRSLLGMNATVGALNPFEPCDPEIAAEQRESRKLKSSPRRVTSPPSRSRTFRMQYDKQGGGASPSQPPPATGTKPAAADTAGSTKLESSAPGPGVSAADQSASSLQQRKGFRANLTINLKECLGAPAEGARSAGNSPLTWGSRPKSPLNGPRFTPTTSRPGRRSSVAGDGSLSPRYGSSGKGKVWTWEPPPVSPEEKNLMSRMMKYRKDNDKSAVPLELRFLASPRKEKLARSMGMVKKGQYVGRTGVMAEATERDKPLTYSAKRLEEMDDRLDGDDLKFV